MEKVHEDFVVGTKRICQHLEVVIDCFIFFKQPQVDDAVPIGTCLMLFGRWLRETRDAKSIKFPCDLVQKKGQEQTVEIADKLCTFVTWSGMAQHFQGYLLT